MTSFLAVLVSAMAMAVPIVSSELTLPCTQPQLAGEGSRVFVACGTAREIIVTGSTDEGRTWTTAGRIPVTGVMSLGLRRGPRVVITSHAVIVSAVVGDKGKGVDGDLLAWSSSDGGRTWSAPVHVNDAAGAAREGLHAMAAHGDTAFAAWLDLRTPGGTTLYGASSTDGGRTWSRNTLVYRSPSGTICQCCHPSITKGDDGAWYVMFRNAIAGARDMYLVRAGAGEASTAAQQPAQKLGQGTWPLEACPMDGGGLAVSGANVVSTWRREGTVYLEKGTQSAEAAIGPGRQPIVLFAGEPVVLYEAPDGLRITSAGRSALVDAGGRFASAVSTPHGVVAAFEREETTYVRDVPLP